MIELWKHSLFQEPRCNSFTEVAAIVGIGIAGTGLGLSVSGALNPSQPNLSADSKAMVDAQNKYLPQLDALQAAAELGQNTLKAGYSQSTGAEETTALQNKIAALNNQLAGITGSTSLDSQQKTAINKQIASYTNQLSSLPSGDTPVYLDSKGNVVSAATAGANFSGYSTADIQGGLMKQLAAGQLATDQQYDPQFIAQALAEEQLANPQGVAARSQEYEDLQKLVNNPPTSPVANEMQRQVGERVAAGSGLTPEEQALLDKSVNGMGGIVGGSGKGPDFSQALTTGVAGTERGISNVGSGAQFLASGETPDDIAYRANQQNIADLSQFYSGQTPQSQFKSLTGAQGGATPIAQSAQLPGVNFGAAQQGAAAGVQGYEAQMIQANPWLSGLSGALGLTGSLGAALGGKG